MTLRQGGPGYYIPTLSEIIGNFSRGVEGWCVQSWIKIFKELQWQWKTWNLLKHALDEMSVLCKVTPQHFIRLPWQIASTHLYPCVQRGMGRVKSLTHNDPARSQTQTPQPKSSSLSIRPPWIPLLRHTYHCFLKCPYWLWVYGSRIFELKLKMWIWKRPSQQSWVQIPYRPEFFLAFFSLLLNK